MDTIPKKCFGSCLRHVKCEPYLCGRHGSDQGTIRGGEGYICYQCPRSAHAHQFLQGACISSPSAQAIKGSWKYSHSRLRLHCRIITSYISRSTLFQSCGRQSAEKEAHPTPGNKPLVTHQPSIIMSCPPSRHHRGFRLYHVSRIPRARERRDGAVAQRPRVCVLFEHIASPRLRTASFRPVRFSVSHSSYTNSKSLMQRKRRILLLNRITPNIPLKMPISIR